MQQLQLVNLTGALLIICQSLVATYNHPLPTLSHTYIPPPPPPPPPCTTHHTHHITVAEFSILITKITDQTLEFAYIYIVYYMSSLHFYDR